MEYNKKTVDKFFFVEETAQEFINKLDETYKVDLNYNKDIIDRIHIRYPLASRQQIEIIVLTIFKTLREIIILGKIFSLDEFFRLKLNFLCKKKADFLKGNKPINVHLKMKILTNSKISGYDTR